MVLGNNLLIYIKLKSYLLNEEMSRIIKESNRKETKDLLTFENIR